MFIDKKHIPHRPRGGPGVLRPWEPWGRYSIWPRPKSQRKPRRASVPTVVVALSALAVFAHFLAPSL